MEKVIAQNYIMKQQVRMFRNNYGMKYSIDKVKNDRDCPGYLAMLKIDYQIKDEDDEQVGTQVYRDLFKDSLKDDV